MKYFFIFIFLFFESLWAQPLRFAPLPMFKSELIMKEYRGILEYLEKELAISIEIVYYSNYKTLLEAIRTSKVDIAHLGPLPFAVLLQDNDQVQPIVQFLNKERESTYTCSYITSQDNPQSLNDLSSKPIALTQPLSTCGYLSAVYLYNQANLDLHESNYYYANTHSNVILEVLLGQAQSGIVKTSEFLNYKHLGLFELAKTPQWPGFLWVGSPNLNPILVSKIQDILTPLSYNNAQHKKIMSSWGDGVKYGVIYANKQAYEPIIKLLKTLKIKELQ
jgi:phosphonate transport system substrate-binding protein